MLILYSSNATSFNHLGLGVLKDYISNPLITEILNGTFTLEFDYAKTGVLSEKLVEGSIIKANNQLFRIKSIKKDMKKISIFAKHIFFDLEDNFLEDVAPTNLTAQGALDWTLKRTKESNDFKVQGNCETVASSRYVEKNPIDAIYNEDNAILKRFGGELELNNFNIFVHKKRGKNSDFSIRYRKNLSGINFNLDFSTVVTVLMPQGQDDLELDEKYLVSSKVNNYYHKFYKKVEFDIGVSEDITEAEAKKQLKLAAQKLFDDGIDEPSISIAVNFIELSKCIEYKEYSNLESCELGDTIQVNIPELNINVNVRIVKTVYDCALKRFIKLELGNVVPNIATENIKNNNSIFNEINRKSNDALTQAKNAATDLMNHPFKGNWWFDKNTGVAYLMDTNDPNTAKNVWKWSLGGLGFSSTGINGTYETAITQDGSIVADFITAGKMSTERIEGFSQLVLAVDALKNNSLAEKNTVSNTGSVTLENCLNWDLLNLKIKGDISRKYDFINSNNTTYPVYFDVNLVVESGINKVKYKLPIEYLTHFNGVYDEFLLENENLKLIKKIGLNNGQKYILDEPVILDKGTLSIKLFDGINKLYLEGFNNVTLDAQYMLKNSYTENFVQNGKIISQINLSPENIKILTSKLDIDAIAEFTNSLLKNSGSTIINGDNILTGIIKARFLELTELLKIGNTEVSANCLKTGAVTSNNYVANQTGTKINLDDGTIDMKNFKVSAQGSATMRDATLTDGILKIGTKEIYNTSGVLSMFQYQCSGAEQNIGWYEDYDITTSATVYKKKGLQILYNIPVNFTVVSAYVVFTHIPCKNSYNYDSGSGVSTSVYNGYARNVKLYKLNSLSSTIYQKYGFQGLPDYSSLPKTEITGAFGTSGFTGSMSGATSVNSLDYKNLNNDLVKGSTQMLLIDTSDSSISDIVDGLQKTAMGTATLFVIGYYKI